MDNNRHINRLTGGKNTMVRIEYTRKSGFVNNIQMKNETYTDILKEYGSVREWLETIIHEGIAVTIEDFGTHGETRSIAD